MPAMFHQTWDDFRRDLERVLGNPLPGFPAQKALAPRILNGPYIRDGRIDQEDAVAAAALILLFPVDDLPHLVLTVRSRDLPNHGGQISLPGGLKEPGESLAQTAIRETNEEIGVDPEDIALAGALSPIFIPPSRFLLHPFVGIAPRLPRIKISEKEVARVMEVSLKDLCNPDSFKQEIRTIKGNECVVPYFALDGEKVWGATAMVLAEFLWVLGYRGGARSMTS